MTADGTRAPDPSPEPARGAALVTGGSGFLGGYVVRALIDDGWEVHVLDTNEMPPEVRFVVGEREIETVTFHAARVEHWPTIVEVVRAVRPRVVVHMAAIMGTGWLSRNPLLALDVNVIGTVNVLEAARLFDVKRVVAFSSLGALAPRQYEPIDANHPTVLAREASGTGFYGASKLASEAFCFAYVSSYALDVRIIRPSMAYGLGMPMGRATSDLKVLVEGAVERRHVRIPTGGSLGRGFTHAADVGSLTVAVLHGPDEADRIFYGATGRPLLKTHDIVRALKEIVPNAELSVGDALSPEQVAESRYRGQLDISNAQQQLGWNPEYAEISAGLARYVDDYRGYRLSIVGNGSA